VNVLNKQLWIADKVWSSSKWVEWGKAASECKISCHEGDIMTWLNCGGQCDLFQGPAVSSCEHVFLKGGGFVEYLSSCQFSRGGCVLFS